MERFTAAIVDGARVVLDAQTNLQWGPTFDKRMTHAQAEEAVKALTIGGFTDWRLPSRVESLGLVDDTKYRPACNTEAFPDMRHDDWYWTGTPDAEDPDGYAWVVHFTYGSSHLGNRGILFWVRPVRASQ